MAAQEQRRLVERWFLGTIPSAWEAALSFLSSRLKSLERILSVLHQAVEYPPPSSGARVEASGTTAITTTSNTDITGATMTFTPDVSMTLLVTGSFLFGCSLFGAIGHFFVGVLDINGVEQPGVVQSSVTAATERGTVTGCWSASLTAGTAYTVKLRARTTNVGTTFNVIASSTTGFTYLKVPTAFRAP